MKSAAWTRRLPWSIVAVAVALVCLGGLGIMRCEELAGGSGRFLRQQMVFSVLALVAMLGVSLPNYRILCRWSYVLFLLSLVLLVVPFMHHPQFKKPDKQKQLCLMT